MAFKSVLDPNFRYRSAASTDVRKTFERVRRELAEKRRLEERESAPAIAESLRKAAQALPGKNHLTRAH